MTWLSPRLFWIGGYLLSLGTVPFILLANKRPASTLAWIWGVLLFPFLGPLFYLLLGSERMHRKRYRNRLKQRVALPRQRHSIGRTIGDQPIDREHNFVETLSTINIQPITSADSFRLLVNAAAFYQALEEAIQTAKKTIHIEFFIWRDDAYGMRFRTLLAKAARRGVKVRVVLDDVGCSRLSNRYFRELSAAGGKFSFFGNVHPMRNRWTFGLRNHRKLQIIDGERAFVGGMNLGREYMGENRAYGPWFDLQIEVTGPVADALENTFADDWFFATNEKIHPAPERVKAGLADSIARSSADTSAIAVQVVEDGPDGKRAPLSLSILAMIHHAQHRLWLTTAYFVPLYSHLEALKLCAARGVDVRMLISAKSEHPFLVEVSRSYYEELLSYGVRIFEFTLGINHGKAMVVDDQWVSLGSANFDNRSMRLNFELNLVFRSPELNRDMAAILERYFEEAKEIQFQSFLRRPFWARLKESACRPLGPIL